MKNELAVKVLFSRFKGAYPQSSRPYNQYMNNVFSEYKVINKYKFEQQNNYIDKCFVLAQMIKIDAISYKSISNNKFI